MIKKVKMGICRSYKSISGRKMGKENREVDTRRGKKSEGQAHNQMAGRINKRNGDKMKRGSSKSQGMETPRGGVCPKMGWGSGSGPLTASRTQ